MTISTLEKRYQNLCIYIYDVYFRTMQQSCYIRSINIILYTLKTKHVCSIIKYSTIQVQTV